jgi:protein disulfide-isomerase A6
LTDTAGKVLTLDTLASNFFSADLPSRSQVIEQAKEYVSSIAATDKKVNASASYYLKAMERVMEKGEAWVSKEQARHVFFGSKVIIANQTESLDF